MTFYLTNNFFLATQILHLIIFYFISCSSDFFLKIQSLHLAIPFFRLPQSKNKKCNCIFLSHNSEFFLNCELKTCSFDFFLELRIYIMRISRKKVWIVRNSELREKSQSCERIFQSLFFNPVMKRSFQIIMTSSRTN